MLKKKIIFAAEELLIAIGYLVPGISLVSGAVYAMLAAGAGALGLILSIGFTAIMVLLYIDHLKHLKGNFKD